MKKAVLLVAYGVSNPHARLALSAFERACRRRIGNLPVRWAYTSGRLRERLAKDRQKSDSVAKALFRLHYENFGAVAVQPLQAIAGREFNDVQTAMEEVSAQTGLACSLGRPLLDADAGVVAEALLRHAPAGRKSEECILFMGHGARHPAEAMYISLNQELRRLDQNCLVGTMGRLLGLQDIIGQITAPVVWLVPLLSNVGKHVLADMAGPGEHSWKSRLEAAGHECRPVLSGLVESADIAGIWLEHLAGALARLG